MFFKGPLSKSKCKRQKGPRWSKDGPRGDQDGFKIIEDEPIWGKERAGRSPEHVAMPGRFGIACRFALLNTCWAVDEQLLERR